MTTIRLQHVPPPLSALFTNVPKRGRVRTERYKVWLQAVGWDMKRYHNVRFHEPVEIAITIGKLRSNSDLSNRVKAIEDLLVSHGVIKDDSVTYLKGSAVRIAQEPFEGVEISITPADPTSLPRPVREAA